jgi:hypothetical protein
MSWWIGIPAAQTTVGCGDQTHRLRWEAGKLLALDHDDPEAERTLAALGGQRCTCVDVLDAWARQSKNARVLTLASRGPADPLVAQDEDAPGWPSAPRPAATPARARVRGWTSYAPISPVAAPGGATAPETRQDELVALLALGGGLPDRLVAAVANHWATRLRRSDKTVQRNLPQLHAALFGRVRAVLVGWLGEPGIQVELELLRNGGRASVTDEEGTLHVALPFTWLVDVWAKGLAISWGRFCLSAETGDGQHWELGTIGPDLGPEQTIMVELPGA